MWLRPYGSRAVRQSGDERVRDPVGSPNASIIRQDLNTPYLVLFVVDPHKGWDLSRSFPGSEVPRLPGTHSRRLFTRPVTPLTNSVEKNQPNAMWTQR